jgi:hypothetical protein
VGAEWSRCCRPRRALQPVAAAARELGCGSPATCWRRLTEWAKAGAFEQLHLEVLDRLGEQGQRDWSRASVDPMRVWARRRSYRGQVASVELASHISGSAAKTCLTR